MKSVKTFISPLVFAAGLCIALPASSDPIDVFNNIGQSESTPSLITSGDWVGQAFTTPAGHFQNATVKVNLSTDGTPTGTFEAAIYDSLSGIAIGSPTGISLATIAIGTGDVTLGLNLGGLTPATTYYLVLSGINLVSDLNNTLRWDTANSNSGLGSGFSTLWAASTDAGTNWTNFTGFPQKMLIQAEIPEPTSLALFAIGLAGLRFSRRKVV